MSTKNALLAWVNSVIPEYKVENFNTNWNDGRALCGLDDRLKPGLCPNHFSLDRSRSVDNCRKGMDLAESNFDIPKVFSPEDLANPNVDDLSVMTYISYFCGPGNQLLLEWIRKKIPKQNIQNFSTDWNNGINLGALLDACFPGVCADWNKMDPHSALPNLQNMFKLTKERLGIDCPVSAAEFSNPEVDEIVVATYLSQFRNAKLRASPEEFSVAVPQLPHGSAIVQEPVKFEINVSKDIAGLLNDIEVNAHGPSSDIKVSVLPTKNESVLEATFTPIEAGSYEMFVVYGGEHVTGSPFSLPVADPSKCQILGKPPSVIQVGKSEEVVVKTRGAGLGSLTCSVDENVSHEIEEESNETFKVKLKAGIIGTAEVSIMWAGRAIPQTPFKVNICDASKCTLSGESLLSGKGRVGEPVKFQLDTTGAGNSTPDVQPRGPSAVYKPDVTDDGNGMYSISFVPWEVGPHNIDVLWGGAHVPKSPFPMQVEAAPDANTCSVSGKGVRYAVADEEASFTVLSPEKDLLKKKKGLEVTISSLEHKVPVGMTDNNTTSYTATYTAHVPGLYVVSVKFYKKHIPGSPFKLEVVPAADASKCKAYGPALHPNSLHIAGSPLDLFVDTKKAGTGDLEVYIQGPKNTSPKVYKANEDGIYSLKFDVPEPGRYRVNIWWSRVHIPGSPFKIKVHPGPNAANVRAHGPGLAKEFQVGEPGRFIIETKNAGIGTLTIRVHGLKGAFKIEANPISEADPRTLTAHYDPKEPGEYTIAIRWSGTHIPKSPFAVNIKDVEKKKAAEGSMVSFVVPEDVDSSAVKTTSRGIPVMSEEQARKYQHGMMYEQHQQHTRKTSYEQKMVTTSAVSEVKKKKKRKL